MNIPTEVEEAITFMEKKFHVKFEQHNNNPIWHGLQVYHILESITTSAGKYDNDLLIAGLLHDVIEDTKCTYKELKEAYNERIADLVYAVTHEGKKDEYGYYFPRLIYHDAMIIKFADRLSNLFRMDDWDDARKRAYLTKSRFWKTSKTDNINLEQKKIEMKTND